VKWGKIGDKMGNNRKVGIGRKRYLKRQGKKFEQVAEKNVLSD
jgi:hypothetical protein